VSDLMLDPESLRNALHSASAPVIIDVRSRDEYSAGHIPEAINIPLTELPVRLAEVPADRPVVTYCMMQHRGQSRGERAAALLQEHGRQAHVMDGGLPAWRAAGFEVEEQATRQ
jgi:rhodanese-related sulfurtransferase